METSSSSVTGNKLESADNGQVLDGSDIIELVENREVFTNFVDRKFQELDSHKKDKLSVKELEPAVADIGAALGLPVHVTHPDSDHICYEVLNEFIHSKQEKVSKTEFKEVLSDILLGMAAGLKRDPIVILRIDGEDLTEFISSTSYEADVVPIFFNIQSSDKSLHDCIVEALGILTVEQGMPPSSDSWVFSNIVEPALQASVGPNWDKHVSEEIFLAEFRKVAECVAQNLKEHPVIVAHSEHAFDGSSIKRLLSNKFEFEKTLDSTLEIVARDRNGKLCKDYLRTALNSLASLAGLPPYGAVDEMDKIVGQVIQMMNADDGKMVKEDEFKKILTEILECIMLQLEGNPVSVSSNAVVHEPIGSSTLPQPPSIDETA